MRLSYPLSNANLGAATPIKVWLKNTGTTTLSNFNLYCYVNGIVLANESPSLNLLPGDSIEYTFTAVGNFNSGVEYHIAILVDVPNDAASSDDVASVIINSTVNILEQTQGKVALSVFPNPAHDTFILQAANLKENAEVNITDISGKRVFNKKLSKEQLEKGIKVTNTFTKGFYMIELKSATETLVEKLVIQ